MQTPVKKIIICLEESLRKISPFSAHSTIQDASNRQGSIVTKLYQLMSSILMSWILVQNSCDRIA